MKKTIIALMSVLLMSACIRTVSSPESTPAPDTPASTAPAETDAPSSPTVSAKPQSLTPAPEASAETTAEQAVIPVEELLGYWVNMKNGDFIGFDANGDWTETYVAMDNLDGASSVPRGTLSGITARGEDAYDITITYEDGRYREAELDLKKLAQGEIALNGKTYVWASVDRTQAYLAYHGDAIGDFVAAAGGMWNCKDDNAFLFIGYDEDGKLRFNMGLYDAGGAPAATIEDVREENGYTYLTLQYEDYDFESGLTTYTMGEKEVDLNHAGGGILVADNVKYEYVGTTFAEGYAEYEKRMYH